MSLELSKNDQLRLRRSRLERLCSCFKQSLTRCFLKLNHSNLLTIHCSEPWIVDQLLSEIDPLRHAAWIYVGVDQLSICFAQEEVYRTPSYRLESVTQTPSSLEAA